MQPGKIAGWTNAMGAPEGWDEQTSEPCNVLHVRVTQRDGYASFESAWFPTPDQIERMIAGAPVIASIAGGQPPMHLYVPHVRDAHER
jgi:hypothetical protein